nr:DUF2262 domain-containing protein [Ruminococcus sp.]
EHLKEYYEETEKEFLVLCIGGTKCGGKIPDGDWTYNVNMIGFVENGKQYSVKGCLTWCEKDGEELYGEVFEETDIYRIRGYLEKSENPKKIYLTEITSGKEKNEFFYNLLTEHNKEVSVNSEILGKVVLNKNYDWYEGNAYWCGSESPFSINLENPDDDITEILRLVEDFYKNQSEWDRKLREFSASQLTELANDWLEDEYYEEDGEETEPIQKITEKDFSERISINSIGFDMNGNFSVYYNDDDMFWGHSIVIYGNIKTGEFESAEIIG